MMTHSDTSPNCPKDWLGQNDPDGPVYFFSPDRLSATYQQFCALFPGEVTYAVKANPDPAVLNALVAKGMAAFDVASPSEMQAVRHAAPMARLHYHNPVRSAAEIALARRAGVISFSVDRMSELDKLGPIEGTEIAVRLKLPVGGAAYDFGAKFGADPATAATLLREVKRRGGTASMTFHPGTQCCDPQAWSSYIRAVGQVTRDADVRLKRLNVGGGFGIGPGGAPARLPEICAAIADTCRDVFGAQVPELVCEPGRAMVAGCVQLALRVKAVSEDAIFLNDGIYGSLSELRDLPAFGGVQVLDRTGAVRRGIVRKMVVFGPTCDSLDRLPDAVDMPCDIAEGDILLFPAMGAYSTVTATRFNGYGTAQFVTLGGTAQEAAGRTGQQGQAV